MKIQLERTFAEEIQLTPYSSDKEDGDLNLSVVPQLNKENDKSFIIQFNLKLFMPKESYKLQIVFNAIFKTDKVVTDDELNGDFFQINAPAIAYPFLRSMVSYLSVTTGHSNIMLPTVNFVEFGKKIPKNK